MFLLLKWFISASAIIISAYIIPGVSIASLSTALWLALFLGLINITLKPLLILFTLPVNILTLGLFTFVINASLILLASSAIKGFEVKGFWMAMFFGIVLSIVTYFLHIVFGTR